MGERLADRLTTAQAGRVLGTSKPTVRAMIERGELQAAWTPHGWLVSLRSVAALLRAREEGRGDRHERLPPDAA